MQPPRETTRTLTNAAGYILDSIFSVCKPPNLRVVLQDAFRLANPFSLAGDGPSQSLYPALLPAVALDVAALRNVQSAHLSDDYAALAQWRV